MSVDLREQMRLYLLRNSPHRVVRSVAQIERARSQLPAEGVVGYVGPRTESGEARYERYYLTQFALAPLIVVDSPNYDRVIGNFLDADGIDTDDFIVVKDLGGGLWLLQRRPR